MSFIYDDDKLILDLLKSAIDHEYKFNKKAQVAAEVNVEYHNFLNLSSKLVDHIKLQYSPQTKDPNVVKSDGKMGLHVSDMNTLGNFFDYILKNNITVGEQAIVYSENQNPKDRSWLPVDAESARLLLETLQDGKRESIKGTYYVNKTLLSTYLNKLSTQINNENDQDTKRFMRFTLSELMEKVNNVFTLRLTPDYKPPEPKLSDELTLDMVANPITPNGNGPAKLTVKDVKSDLTLNAWIRNNNMTLKVNDKLININESYDKCAFINALYVRAHNKSNSASQETTQAASYYLKMIVEIAKTISCSINGGVANQSTNQSTNQPIINTVIMSQIFQTLPFIVSSIDFNRIETFLNLVLKIIPSASVHINAALDAIKSFGSKHLKIPGTRSISLNINTPQFVSLLIEPSVEKLYPAITALNNIIDKTRDVLDQFYSTFRENIVEPYKTQIEGQIGSARTSNSIYNQNFNNLIDIRGTAVIRPAK